MPIAQCALLPTDIQNILGPIDGPVWMSKSISDTSLWRDHKDGNGACMVRLAPRPGVPKGSIVAFEAIEENAIAFETGANAINAGNEIYKFFGVATPDGAQQHVDGWDYLGAYPREMTGRVGSLAIHADWGGVAVSPDSIEKIMAIMRDKLPDYPGGAQGEGSVPPDGEDPCSLVTRDEAESVLGKLVVKPYRSRELSGLVDETGTGCSYYTKNHHVLSLRPWWSHGRRVFDVSSLTRSVSIGEDPDVRALTAWDTVRANEIWDSYFLKGDRLLAVSGATSSVSYYEMLKIASIAMKKLMQ
jgi:hypothetical protein